MLTDRSEINRVIADQEAVTGPWWQDRTNSWAQHWSRRAVDSRITMSASHAAALSLACQLCGGAAELRWKRFLLRASRWEERPVRRGLN
jgi:hypothetical protein